MAHRRGATDVKLLAQIVFPAPYGVVFIADLHNRQSSPAWGRPDQVVAGTDAAIRVRVVQGQVQPADIRVSWGTYEGTSQLVYQGSLELRFGRLLVTDANEENALVIGIEPGRREIRIYANSTPWPTRVDIVIDQP
jgi:hypothetical protein